jgi:Uma2 family endonuclease
MREKQAGLGPLSVEEFLAFEAASPTRHEYVAGRVYSMSGTTSRHNEIALNIVTLLRAAARGGACKAYMIDLKVRAARDRIYYPDGMVVCTPHDGDTLIFDDPCLIVEVTSRSTRRIDRGEKLDAYLEIPSLKAYLVAEHDRRHVTLYSREPGGDWGREEVVTSGRLSLPCPATTLSLDDVYEGVEMPPLRVREDADEDDGWADVLEPSLPGD